MHFKCVYVKSIFHAKILEKLYKTLFSTLHQPTIVSNLYQLETKQLIVTAEMLALGV